MTRLWLVGSPIIILGSADAPEGFRWQGRTHRIQHLARRWRVDVEWWRLRIWRDYFRVATDTGLLVVLYHDLQTGQWYVQRLYD
jgi:hypothetical protein